MLVDVADMPLQDPLLLGPAFVNDAQHDVPHPVHTRMAGSTTLEERDDLVVIKENRVLSSRLPAYELLFYGSETFIIPQTQLSRAIGPGAPSTCATTSARIV